MVSGFCEMKRQKSILSYTDCVNIDQSNAGDDVAVDEGVNVAVDEQQPSTSSVCAEQSIDISYPSTDGIIFCDFETVSFTLIFVARLFLSNCVNIRIVSTESKVRF